MACRREESAPFRRLVGAMSGGQAESLAQIEQLFQTVEPQPNWIQAKWADRYYVISIINAKMRRIDGTRT